MFEFLSNDPLFSLLKSLGYNTIRLPRSTIKPLQLYTKKNNQLNYLGPLSDVFNSRGNFNLPAIKKDQQAAKISGKKSGELSLGLGFSILDGILSSLGASALGIDAKYKQAKTISFQYEDVLEDKIDITSLDKFLSDSDINPFSKCVGDLLESDEVRVTTSIIKSSKFTILPRAGKGIDLDIKIPDIQKIVGGNVKVTSKGKDASAITFEGSIPIAFGFQAWRLFYDDGKITRIEPERKVTLESKSDAPTLISKNAFISMMGE